MKVLLTAPYVGEFGWEVMAWQGRVRRWFHEGGFDRVCVLGAPGKEALYADLPLTYRSVDLSGLPGRASMDGRVFENEGAMLEPGQIRDALALIVHHVKAELEDGGADVIERWPGFDGTLWPCAEPFQQFVRYGDDANRSASASPCVALVRRTRACGAANWVSSDWDALSDRLRERGIDVVDMPLDAARAIELLSRCDLAVGQSTGGLHLASLCGCPHVVWSPEPARRWTRWQMTNRQRYDVFWNPFGTPVQYHGVDGLPSVDDAVGWTMAGMRAIGRRTGTARALMVHRQAWRLRRWVVDTVLPSQAFRRSPWRVQNFVKQAMV